VPRQTQRKAPHTLPEDVNEFEGKHLEFIALRGAGHLSQAAIARRLRVCEDTVRRWDRHPPFAKHIRDQWATHAKHNVTLAGELLNRALIKLERWLRLELEVKARKRGHENVLTVGELMRVVTLLKDIAPVPGQAGKGVPGDNGHLSELTVAELQVELARERDAAERLTALFDKGGSQGRVVSEVESHWPLRGAKSFRPSDS